ncbi:hypothetical protein [Methylobacterium isbiliense]|jgi:hypothetical protein|uniref:Uncharacterized protein n=1 Tax=Methylobacterium isbiliense TaxID=315478 RepID=A0ABQ4S9J0_9HYPH|nr:hypothetical protein [Methylobacterium isbiliense]MDN3622937.1 hypothetical protein [Methylobacterium isbiliense]GJD98807.1 hypothetical protein GMJLKIPL_0720 [Methylobacterium isbiliense]
MACIRLVICERRDDARLGPPRTWPGLALKVTNRTGLAGYLAGCDWPAGDTAETFLDWCAATLPEAWIQIRKPAPPSAAEAISITMMVGMRGAKPDPHGEMKTRVRWPFPCAGW